MHIKFDGFSDPQRQQLIAAAMVLKSASAKAKAAVLGGDLAAFSKWFDSTGSNLHLMKVATIIKEIDDAIQNRPITFANATGNTVDKEEGGLCGYVWKIRNDGPGDYFGATIHAGSGMRVLMVPKTHDGNINDLAETMYHELSHKVGGTTDLSYKVPVCLGYANTDTQRAALNAENYNRFLGEFIT
jgi:Icc-related predicted phosphoesterase